MSRGLSTSDINKLARIGAAARLSELEAEIAGLRRAFPGLVSASGAKASATPAVRAVAAGSNRKSKPGRKHPMTAAERRVVSERMKKYWAERHKTKG